MKLVIIGRSGCKYCESAKILAFERGVDFEYKTLDKDISREELTSLIGNEFRTVPQIFVIDNGTDEMNYIGGYDDLVVYFKEVSK